MSDKILLRTTRKGTIINGTSSGQEKKITIALETVLAKLRETFGGKNVKIEKSVYLNDVIKQLKAKYPKTEFDETFQTSAMKPDGGIVYIIGKSGDKFPVLISEVKNQGTNDLRATEGLRAQARGNAIERLGKNVIGFRAMLMTETIFPFICFGYGCDFEDKSSIIDRVKTIAMFGKLNKIYLHNQDHFNRGSFFFRPAKWTIEEMVKPMYEIAKQSIEYYLQKYGESNF